MTKNYSNSIWKRIQRGVDAQKGLVEGDQKNAHPQISLSVRFEKLNELFTLKRPAVLLTASNADYRGKAIPKVPLFASKRWQRWRKNFRSTKMQKQDRVQPAGKSLYIFFKIRRTPIEKSIGCDHMVCNQCQYSFCYLCGGSYYVRMSQIFLNLF